MPYSLVLPKFVEEESRYYVNLLTQEWTRDHQRFEWAAQRSTRTGNEPAALLGFIALAEFDLGMAKITQGTTTTTKRKMSTVCHRHYRYLSQSPFSEWVIYAERCASVLGGEEVEGRLRSSSVETEFDTTYAEINAVETSKSMLRSLPNELSAATKGSDAERWAALSGTMNDHPVVQRVNWLHEEEGWDHASRAISGVPAETLNTQARVYEEHFVSRWATEVPALVRRHPLFDGLVRVTFDGWIVGYAESEEDWTIEAPWSAIPADLLGEATANRLDLFDQEAVSDAAFYCLENARGVRAYQQVFRPLGISATDVLSTAWGRDGMTIFGELLVSGYCLAQAQKSLVS